MASPLAPTPLRGSLGTLALAVAAAASVPACSEALLEAPSVERYHIVAGACGDVVFAEAVAADSASARALLEAREATDHPGEALAFGLIPLSVVDEDGEAPPARFYALEVRAAGGGVTVHSVVDVFTTGGDLFHLAWCPD